MKIAKNRMVKMYLVASAFFLALIPGTVGATSPSQHIINISNGFWGEIQAITPKVALVVIGFALLMYFLTGEEHKKSKWKGTIVVALIVSVCILFLPGLYSWFTGLA